MMVKKNKDTNYLNRFVDVFFNKQSTEALDLLETMLKDKATRFIPTKLRLAALKPGQNTQYYLRLANMWNNLGRPALKPNPTCSKAIIFSDYTANNLVHLSTLFCASLGLEIDLKLSSFDSVEQEAFDPPAEMLEFGPDLVLLTLSEYWLKRYLGQNCLVHKKDVNLVKSVISGIVTSIAEAFDCRIILCNFPGLNYSIQGGSAKLDELLGWDLALLEINYWLSGLISRRIYLADLSATIFGAGGRSILGKHNYMRAKMAFQAKGEIAVARELGLAISSIYGKSHRALVTDWDNTLWGGVLGEVGATGVVCGFDTPEALGYRMVQEQIRGLRSLGVLLGAASKNDPSAAHIFSESQELILEADDFASVQVGWGPKSESIAQIADDMGFGPEYMVFLDDSLHEISEVLAAHPSIDVLRAGPNPETTLETLSESRFFNTITISEADLKRNVQTNVLKRQREFKASYTRVEDFLQEIDIKLTVCELNAKNLHRVCQMFQKTNQFNFTTRRHGEKELKEVKDDGGTVVAFSYEDIFGDQGIIAAVVLVPGTESVLIESWLMSCRVFKRTVEHAVLEWIIEWAGHRPIIGEYRPTVKNEIIREFYPKAGFSLLREENDSGSQFWSFNRQSHVYKPQVHFVTIND